MFSEFARPIRQCFFISIQSQFLRKLTSGRNFLIKGLLYFLFVVMSRGSSIILAMPSRRENDCSNALKIGSMSC